MTYLLGLAYLATKYLDGRTKGRTEEQIGRQYYILLKQIRQKRVQDEFISFWTFNCDRTVTFHTVICFLKSFPFFSLPLQLTAQGIAHPCYYSISASVRRFVLLATLFDSILILTVPQSSAHFQAEGRRKERQGFGFFLRFS